MKNKSSIIITSGDPNGIGPEIILKILNNNPFNNFDVKVIGDKYVFDYYSKLFNLNPINPEKLIDLDFKYIPKPGTIDNIALEISNQSVLNGIRICKKNSNFVLITMPVIKKALKYKKKSFAGHTGMLQFITKSNNVNMIMYFKDKFYLPLTQHISLKEVAGKITKKFLIKSILNINENFKKYFNVKDLNYALLSLNPHSGDEGVIGYEEIKYFNPAIKYLMKNEIKIEGPFSADGFFGNKVYNKFKCIIGIYHDQILTPFKILSEGNGVNFTAGLPFIRISPAHGTALDIAGKNVASTSSSLKSIELAEKFLNN